MEQVESIASSLPVPRVELLNALTGGAEDERVVRYLRGDCVGEIAEDGEMDPSVVVAERLDRQVLNEPAHLPDVHQQRRDDHDRPPFLRDTAAKVESGEAAWRHEGGREPLDEGSGKIAGGDERQRRDPRIDAPSRGQGHRQTYAQSGQGADAPQVEWHR